MTVDVHVEESPEVLRWRAELLLDEMMLGAVDASAGEPRIAFASRASSLGSSPQPGDAPSSVAFQAHENTTPVSSSAGRVATATNAPSPSHSFPVAGDGGNVGPLPQANRAQNVVVAVEQRYVRYANNQAQPNNLTPSANGGNGAANSSNGSNEYDAPSLGPVRRSAAATLAAGQSAGVGAMSVVNRNAKYTNLLPRSSTWDAREMQREIVALHEEIDRLLPASHETNQRTHHLLDKANGILASDPLRSAEVDYYLAQVRAIVQRVSQNVEWSALYRQRLTLYLAAWVALSLVMIAGCFLYGDQIAATLSRWFGWGEGNPSEAHIGFLLTAACAGGLGASVGALLTMRRSSQRKYGFIDRKYSLRSLVLPIMGIVVGLALYLAFGLVYWALGLVPDQSMWLPLAPALLAFAFGLFQESIYGTRE
jgi:hypothetical protein